MFKRTTIAALLGLASLGAQAQGTILYAPMARSLETVIATATRSLQPNPSTLREAVVVTREELEAAGTQSIADILQRRAGAEIAAAGGAGQPAGLLMRGTAPTQSLVLVDGMRLGSPLTGLASLDNIPVELIERIEVVKGPLSSLYGSEAMGGVIQLFTRSKKVPYLFTTVSYGEDNDTRIAAGVTGTDATTSFSLTGGARKVDAPSATNARHACFDEDRDPYENAYFEGKFSQRFWQGETLALNAFISHGKAHFDGCPDAQGARHDDLRDQTNIGAGLTSSTKFTPQWSSRLSYAYGEEETELTGAQVANFHTRQQQVTWLNEFPSGRDSLFLVGLEGLRQEILSPGTFAKDKRDVASAFAGATETWQGQRAEASVRRDEDDQYGDRTTGSVSWGMDWPGWGYLTATYAEGFRAPSMAELYGPDGSDFRANPLLLPESNKMSEVALASRGTKGYTWKIAGFDNELEDLIAFDGATGMLQNVARARIKGLEVSGTATWWGVRWRAAGTFQEAEDRETRKRLQGRAEAFGTLEATWQSGGWTVAALVTGSGDRYDSRDEAPESRLPGYAVLDVRTRYQVNDRWGVELNATNLLDKRYETAIGYDAPRRGVMLKVTFEAF